MGLMVQKQFVAAGWHCATWWSAWPC